MSFLVNLARIWNAINGKADKSQNLADLPSASTARTNLGLGSAAMQNTSAFDAAGAASTVNTSLNTHIANHANPHSTTAAQVGALPSTGGNLSGDVNSTGNISLINLVANGQVRTDNLIGGSAPIIDVASDLDCTGYTVTANTFVGNFTGALKSSNNLSDLGSAATARTNLGLGSAATQASTAFDAAGAASTVQTNLTTHTSNTANPHATTAAQVGALPTTGGTMTGTTTFSSGNLVMSVGGVQLSNTTAGLLDANSKNVLTVFGAVSAVNYWQFTNSATLQTLNLNAQGTDTNINVAITPKGSGTLTINGSGGLNVAAGPLKVNTHQIADTLGALYYVNGHKVTDTSNNLLCANGVPVADASGNLYYAWGGGVFAGVGYINDPGGYTLHDGSGIHYPGGGGYAIDSGGMYYPDGTLFLESGALYTPGGYTLADTSQLWYPDNTGSPLCSAAGLFLKWFGGSFAAYTSTQAGTLAWDQPSGMVKAYGTTWDYLNTSKLRIEPYQALTFSSTTATNAALGSFWKLTATSNFTLSNPTNAVDGQIFRWRITQGGSGSYTITLGTKFNVPAAITVTLSTAVGKSDVLSAVYNATADKFEVMGFIPGY